MTMTEDVTVNDAPGWLAERFEEERGRLHGVAYRMLGSATEAEDAVQEAWHRLSRSDEGTTEDRAGSLTSVVARVCLDLLRARKPEPEEPFDDGSLADMPRIGYHGQRSPENDTLLADSISAAMLLVLETLSPAERVAFVLHDMLDFSFDDIAPIVDKSPMVTHQLVGRARRRVQQSIALQ